MVASLIIVVIRKTQQLSLQVASGPKGRLVDKFPPDGPYESFHEGVRDWYIGNSLHLHDVEDSQIGLPSMKFEQRIMIAADVLLRSSSTDRSVEHPAER